MTAGTVLGKGHQILTGGGELRMQGNRGSITHMSQMTPSQQPLTGEDRLPNGLPAYVLTSNPNLVLAEARTLVTPQDTQNLLNFKNAEHQRANTMKKVPDLQTPYPLLAQASEQLANAQDYDHSKKRIFFSNVDELDCAVSESNRIKKIIYRHNLSF